MPAFGYFGGRLALGTLTASSSTTAAEAIQQTGSVVRLSRYLAAKASTTPTATVQSSPTEKSYQNRANAVSRPITRMPLIGRAVRANSRPTAA